MATTYNRFSVNILCIADSSSVTDLQSKILQVLSTVPKLTVKTTNFDTWVDGMTGVVPDAALHDDQIARLHQKRNNVLCLRHAVGITVGDAQNDGLVAGKENLFG